MSKVKIGEKKQEKSAKELEERILRLEEKWKRAVADYRNLEKRVAKEQAEFARFSNSVLISKLLPALDDFEEAAQKSTDWGAEKILKKLRAVLGEAGLSEIEALGKDFDPGVMEGLPVDASAGEDLKVNGPAGSKVTEVARKGYLLNGRLLRPARVRVGKN